MKSKNKIILSFIIWFLEIFIGVYLGDIVPLEFKYLTGFCFGCLSMILGAYTFDLYSKS